MSNKKVFIGGSISIRKLPKLVLDKLNNIINKQFDILIGDAPGVDTLVQQYLFENNYLNVTVFHIHYCRNNVGNWSTRKVPTNGLIGRKAYMQKDIVMANLADYGFQIWDGKSKGTWNNILNLYKQYKYCLIWCKNNLCTFDGERLVNI